MSDVVVVFEYVHQRKESTPTSTIPMRSSRGGRGEEEPAGSEGGEDGGVNGKVISLTVGKVEVFLRESHPYPMAIRR